MATLTIDPRFNGPMTSANGGVACGLLAQATGLAQVTLRRPPPLGRAMEVRGNDLYDGEHLVAAAAGAEVGVRVPDPVSLEQARTAASSYRGLRAHPYPTCFVCGPDHPTGLQVYPGEVAPGVVAAPWTPERDDPVMVWAALDCPSAWTVDLPGRPLLLGRMALRLDALPTLGEEHVVGGWLVGEEGRKVLTGSALWTARGELLAVAQHTWVVVQP